MTKTQQSKSSRGRPKLGRKRVHVYLDQKLEKQVRDIAERERRAFSDQFNLLIERGLSVAN